MIRRYGNRLDSTSSGILSNVDEVVGGGMEKRAHVDVDSSDEDEAHRSKVRRAGRACLQCRARKQRCMPSSQDASAREACKKCRSTAVTCSFELEEPFSTTGAELSGSRIKMAQVIVDMQRRFCTLERRVAELEGHPQTVEVHPSPPSRSVRHTNHINGVHAQTSTMTQASPQEVSPAKTQAAAFDMNALELGPPIATLRRLGMSGNARFSSEARPSNSARHDIRQTVSSQCLDPISLEIMSRHDAQTALTIFFQHCHPMAPVLSEELRHSGLELRHSNPLLFLAICSIGARFWEGDRTKPIENHRQYDRLVQVLDKAIAHLLLQPLPSDVNLDSIRALLLYVQWMPCAEMRHEDGSERDTAFGHKKSRYNDVSAWAVLGLAIRYAHLMGLNRLAIAPFDSNASSSRRHSREDASRLRVWFNLMTCDYNLMLSSGLSASIDPTSAAKVAPYFATSSAAQYPADLRVCALVELVMIAHLFNQQNQSSADLALSLERANTSLDRWEYHWLDRLRGTEGQHMQLPFTSVRWYRLSLNSLSLRSLLSTSRPGSSSSPESHAKLDLFLHKSLSAAAQMIFSLCTLGPLHTYHINTRRIASFPDGQYSIDEGALEKLFYAVDSAWVSHTFAVTFLILCFVRGVIDDDLQSCFDGSINSTTNQTCAPNSPRTQSILARLIRLAVHVYDHICQRTTSFHPAQTYRAIVTNAASLILPPSFPIRHDALQRGEGTQQDLDHTVMQSLLDLMNNSGLEYFGNLFDTDPESALDETWNFDVT